MEKGYMVLASLVKGVEVEPKEKELLYAEITKLASTQGSELILGQLMSMTATQLLEQPLNWLENIADVRRGSRAEDPVWKVPYSGIYAEVQALNSTPVISKIFEKTVKATKVQIGVRPKISQQDLIKRPELLVESLRESVIRMESTMVKYIQDAMLTTFVALGSPNYETGANVVPATLKNQINIVKQLTGSPVSVLGDIGMVDQLPALTGFNNRVPDQLAVEANSMKFIGTFYGSNVVELTNRFVDESSIALTNSLLRRDLLFVVPTGAVELRPLKVFVGGDVAVRVRTNFEDGSLEYIMTQDFATAVVGNQKITAIYKDTNK